MQGRMGPAGGGSGGGGSSTWPDGSLSSPGGRFTNDPNNGVRLVGTDYWALVVGGVDAMRMYSDTYGSRAAFGNTGEPLTANQAGTVLIAGHITSANNNGTIAFAPSIINNGVVGADGVTGFPDSAAIQSSIYQTEATAKGGMRCIAAQVIRARADNAASTMSGIEIGVASSKTGHAFETNGQAPKSMGLWVAGTTEATLIALGETAVQNDCGIYISGDPGFRKPLAYRDAAGTMRFMMDSTGVVMLSQAGNAAAPTLTWIDDTDTGFWRIGANGFGIATGGTEAVRIDGSQNVGIGNISLTGNAKLEVGGNIAFNGNARRFLIDGSGATLNNRAAFQSLTTDAATILGVIPNGTAVDAGFAAYSNSTPTNASMVTLQVNNTAATVQSTISGTGTYRPLAFYTNGAEGMRLDTSSNLGVGGTAPSGSRIYATGGLIEANAGFKDNGSFTLTSVISPAALAAQADDYNPTGLSTAAVIRISTTGSQNITGIVAQGTGRVLKICYIGAATLVFKNNTTSTAANRFFTPGGTDYTLSANGSCTLWYDVTSACWRILDNS